LTPSSNSPDGVTVESVDFEIEDTNDEAYGQSLSGVQLDYDTNVVCKEDKS
jgi:hypothetical protein